MNINFDKIVKSFEDIASSLVLQQDFKSLVTTRDQVTFVAEKVCLWWDDCGDVICNIQL